MQERKDCFGSGFKVPIDHFKAFIYPFLCQVLVQQPQILKTDSLVLTTLKPDGTQVLSTLPSSTGITTLTTPIQNTALQVPVNSVLIIYILLTPDPQNKEK